MTVFFSLQTNIFFKNKTYFTFDAYAAKSFLGSFETDKVAKLAAHLEFNSV